MKPRLLILAAPFLLSLAAAEPRDVLRSSTIAVTRDGAKIVAVNGDSGTISIMDADHQAVAAEISVCAHPRSLSLHANEAWIACADGNVVMVRLDSGTVALRRLMPYETAGIVATNDSVYVTAPSTNRVLFFDKTLSTFSSIATEERPRGMALDDTRRTLYVTHFQSGRLSLIDIDARRVRRVIETTPGANLSQTILIDGATQRAYLPQTRTNHTNPALLFDTTLFPIVSVVDLAAEAHLPGQRIAIDVADKPVNMPTDAVIQAGRIYVVNSGSDDISVIDLARGRGVANIDLHFNPTGIAVSPDGRTAYVNNALSGMVSFIDTATDRVTRNLLVTNIPLPPDVLNGKILFHSSVRTQLAKDRWISCATCHPDGGMDGRTWFFRDGPRNTTSLFGIVETMPLHWSGDLDELQDVESTIRVVQAGFGLAKGESFCEPSCDAGPHNAGRSKDLDDLAAFMRSLQSPRFPGGADLNAAIRGRALFAGPAQCASCHPAPLFTDRRKHDVGTGRSAAERKGSSFDTPSLRGVYDTAPYFHDGSAATLREAIIAPGHGLGATLDASQVSDLVEFLRSIPFGAPRTRRVHH